ncbi:hypothetical protein BAUCODRAFT_30946 [Baudoinia panamericana UAMH 10762]|uniref:Major facilitator superfamily (MFS) profile domain-containing protein n=1 Tax=Baudoinia panamericana (strain UAMH 10762) TaxID=717646 RepID=M2MPK4_BAUPA|nr:uncharacterized protein BAUCODRAFT_30946 [Baudoinia panamericana UAMH 10762]EMC98681.1 hypothetical protein BAUCODRAFT_30946 [Baudoinia panamericana UAMH 10762]
MQSLLQYRRFRTAAKAQLERDRAKSQGHHISPVSDASDDSKIDLEKGEDDHAQPPPIGVNPGEIDPKIGPPMPDEEHETMQENQRPGGFLEETEETLQEADEDDDDELAGQHRLSRLTTQQSARTRLGQVLTGVNIRKRTTKEGGEGDVFVVGFEGENDALNPHNWSYWYRIPCTLLVAAIGCVVGIASAIDSSALQAAARDFGVSEVVESMATGLFLVGFGAGALLAGPISETVGRNPVYIVTLVVYMIFIMASGLAPNIGAQLAFRFLAGLFGSTPLTCAGGSISDLWSPLERVFAFPIFANAAFTGPLLGPVMGGYIVQFLDWRWVEWITLIISGLVLALVVLFQPETYPPILLKWKAKHLRALANDDRYRAEIEVRQESLFRRLKRALYRPFLLTSREPIIILIALYLTVIYIVLFTFLDGYTYVFTDTYGISEGLTGICFLGIIVGLFGASALVPLIYKWAKRDLQKIKEAGGERLPPEFRLWYSMLGGAFAIPISLFWMGWTARPTISIWSPLAASALFGYGILCVFITSYQYIIDAYETYAASALASITLIRYVAAGGMVIVGIPFYENMGVAYTLTILACLSALLVPVPYVFYKYGPWIRTKSKYAVRT